MPLSGGLVRGMLLGALVLGNSVLAATRLPGTSVIYSVNQDPITDANTSVVLLDEQYDETGDTAFIVRCSNRSSPELWATLSSRHDLVGDDDTLPEVIFRLGSDAPVPLTSSSLYTVSDASDVRQHDRLGLDARATQTVVNGLLAGKRLVVRVTRASGGQPLTYTFAAAGFASAWQAVNGCRTGTAPVSAAVSVAGLPTGPRPAAVSGAPTFVNWNFSGCAANSQVTAGLIAGRTSQCTLNVNIVPNGTQVIGAEFRYELEYTEGNRKGKLTLEGVDRWSASGGGNVGALLSPTRLSFTLPLNVRARPDRRYTVINAIGTLVFDNGSSKRVYEALPIQSP